MATTSLSVTIDPVAGDGIINNSEANQAVTVTGGTSLRLVADETIWVSVNGTDYYLADILPNKKTWNYLVKEGQIGALLSSDTITVEVRDAGGSVLANSRSSYIVDTAAPAAGTLSLANLAGSAAATTDRTFDLALAGQESGATVAYEVKDASGSWIATTAAQADLADGTYQFRAVVADAAGNLSHSNEIAVTVDTAAPAAGTLSLANLAGSAAATTDRTFDLALAGQESGATVAYEVKDASGSWIATTAAQADLADGTYQFRAVVADAAGNLSHSNEIAVTVDTAAPAAGTLSLANLAGSAAATTDRTFDLALAGQESGATVAYEVKDASGSWIATTAAQADLADGTYQFRAVVADAAGNLSHSNEIAVTVDTAAPAAGTLSLANLAGSAAATTDRTFDLALAGQESGATVAYEVKDASGSWIATTAAQADLADGTYQFRAVVADAAGNLSHSNEIAVTVDTAAPAAGTLSLANLAGSAAATTDRAFDLALAGQESGATVAYEVKGASGSWIATTAAQADLADGTYQFRAVVADAGGNLSYSNQIAVTVDTAAPAVSVAMAAPSANGTSTVTLTFSEPIENFISSDLQVIGGSVSDFAADASGHIFTGTFTPAANFDGLASVTVMAGSYTDAAGNAGLAGTMTLEVDTKAPTVDVFLDSFLGRQGVLTFSFSEVVNPGSLTADDVIVGGATITSPTPGNGTSHSALLQAALSSSGTISVAVKNGSYTDNSGNAGAGIFETFNITTFAATGSADWLLGTSGKNVLKGGAGDDIIRGGRGSDVIVGGTGKDLLDLSDGARGITITLSQTNKAYSLFDGRKAGLGVDKYRDMEGVVGSKFKDVISGSAKGDILAGLGGNDILRGGGGNDVFVFEATGGRDRIQDFGDKARNQDTLDLKYFDFDVTRDTFAAWKASHVKQVGASVVIDIDAANSVKLMNVKAKAVGFDDFLF